MAGSCIKRKKKHWWFSLDPWITD